MKWIHLSIALLLISMVIGFLYPHEETIFEQSPLYQMLEPYREIYRPYELSTAIFLFFKNSYTLSIGFFLSPILIIPPMMILILNGFIIGFIAGALPLDFTIKALAPHGIFELSALVLAMAGGMNFGFSVIMKIFRKNYSILKAFKDGVRLFLYALALIFIAAIIETYVTPFILGL
ncbi:MAG: stage II sporulation protein M [Candidatus Methanomethyliaceae archaeon]|nr:stage II sporulation protein M [Candidatus Methanomethyliaceae archaeon]MDW7971114.1 stage II sporulation protein M [Nitrososphaerota archaeon]